MIQGSAWSSTLWVCILLSIPSHTMLISNSLSRYWYVANSLASPISFGPDLNLVAASALSRLRWDTNIDMVTDSRHAMLCRDIHQKNYTTITTGENQCRRCLLQMGSSTTQRSTTPNRWTKYATKMPVSKISRGELGQKGNTVRCGQPQGVHGSPGQQ